MKNINYDLLKLLHSKLDTVWRLEKFYVRDADEAKCHSKGALEQILKEEREHIAMLRQEIKGRIDAGILD